MDVVADVALIRIQLGTAATFRGREELRQDGAPMGVEIACERVPVIGCNSRLSGRNTRGRGHPGGAGTHIIASFWIS
jgi:hypothetical protein